MQENPAATVTPQKSKKVYDFTQGKMFKNILLFSVPGLIIAVIQLVFDNVGTIVIGKTGTVYQAAVGASAPIISFGLSFLIHLGGGGGLAVAVAAGKGDEEKQNRIIHTSAMLSFSFGPFVALLGNLLARPVLIAMDTPAECLELAVTYVRVYFLCAPARLLYNFALSITRGLGDSKKPLRYVLAAGGVKMTTIFLTVLVLKWHVVGIAVSTVLAEYVAAVWGLADLKKGYGNVRWRLKETRFYGKDLVQILCFGFPTVLASWSLAFASLAMQSKINAYGAAAIAGSSVAASVNSIVYLASSAFSTTAGTFVGQNCGAKNYKRVRSGMFFIMGVTLLCALVSTGFAVLFKEQVYGLFNRDPAVLEQAYLRMENDLLHGSFLQVLANVYGMALSGMGYAPLPMCTNLLSVAVNLVWVWAIYPLHPTLEFLYLVFPVTAVLTGAGDMLICHLLLRKQIKKGENGQK